MGNPILNIISTRRLATPLEIRKELFAGPKIEQAVSRYREEICEILEGRNPRLIMVVGPCSIHDPEAGLEYAGRLAGLAKELKDRLLIIMRVYFEKPRTPTGWKGLINDPDLDDSFQVEKGLRMARKFLLDVTALGLPVGSEALDAITPQYLGDLVSWYAIGARTSESQSHRDLASGLAMPVGFKNGADGSIEDAVSAIHSSQRSFHFLGITDDGVQAVFTTKGNTHPHIILRGGEQKTNYSARHIETVEKILQAAKAPLRIMVDCSHGNSEKDPRKQADVLRDCMAQIENGNTSIIGFMLESHLHALNQPIQSNRDRMEYGVSVTDPCIAWDTTEELLREVHQKMKEIVP